ncbi:MAG: FAD-dependent oxidoreductase [Alphaproteobacteria bacterium]|nr:FAD-dependent oxidoreductase [Alphaproteobacteria bacterium]
MFDLIVIGAGSSGCALAARASEDPNRHVLLVEAGPDYSDLRSTPFDLVNSHNNSYSAHDWGLSYLPTAGRDVRFPRGRVTGGSSAVNTTIALRGVPEDFAEWAATGLPEWNWEGVLPAYRRLERDLDFGERAWHGDAGPIPIRRYPASEMTLPHLAFFEAAKALGYPECADANEPEGWGASPQPMNKLGRLRVSCAVGYLAPARIRPNLDIRPETLVTRLIIENGRCTAVEVRNRTGAIEIIRARLIVLAAGAIMSPAILMRSGLGPRAQLEAHGVEVHRDIPGVGQNLSDHPALSVTMRPKDPAMIDHDAPIIQSILRYTAPGSDKRCDLQIEMLSFTGRRDEPQFGIAGVVEYQHGRGELRLASADPDAAPVIDMHFCEDDRDLERLVACYRDVLDFARQPAIADLAEDIVFPRGGSPTDERIAGLCRRFAGSGYHPCGTAKMGPASDPMAVVDQQGLCHGVDGLVVADASIMPAVPRANTNLTAIMIGEKIGEWLRTRPALYGL